MFFGMEPRHQLSSSSPWLQIRVLPGDAQRECDMDDMVTFLLTERLPKD